MDIIFRHVYSVAQLCSTLCDPIDCSRSSTSVHGIFQVRSWSYLPFPSPGGLPDPGIKPISAELARGFFTTRATWEAQWVIISNSDTVILTLRFTNMPAGQGPPMAEPPRDTGMVPMERGPLTRRTSDAEVSHGSGKVAHAVPHTHTPKEVVTGVQGGWQWCRVVKVG